MTQQDVSKVFGADVRMIRKHLRKLGVLRSPSEVTKLMWKYGARTYNYKALRKYWDKKREESMGNKVGGPHGYVLVFVGYGGKFGGNYEYEHRLVWEKHNGPLPSDWIVHHLNGVRTDNRI